MKYLIWSLFVGCTLVGCTPKKADSANTTQATAPIKQSLPDSVEQAIGITDRRLDVKMRRKEYTPQAGKLVTLQKWFEYGDTNRLVKLREEIITGDSRMDVIQYHYIGQTLAEVHDYTYDKKCGGAQQQCIQEAKYFFRNGQFDSAVRREATGTADSIPVVERMSFQPFKPDQQSVQVIQQDKLGRINEKYASLPYKQLSKPR